MKLLFPLFASLMLQYQVKSEFVVVKRCLMGFGRCKDSCLADETHIQACKTKKCCIGPKVTELIKSYLKHEIPHLPDNAVMEMLKTEKDSKDKMKRKNTVASLSQISDAKSLSSINSANAPDASPLQSVNLRTRRGAVGDTASTKRHFKQSRDSASAVPQPPP